MVFTQEDGVVIKFLRQKRLQRLVKEFTLKNWKIGCLNKLLKKIDDSDIKHLMFTSQVMKLMFIVSDVIITQNS